MAKNSHSEVVRAGEAMADILEQVSMSANGYGRLIHDPSTIERMVIGALADWQNALDSVEQVRQDGP